MPPVSARSKRYVRASPSISVAPAHVPTFQPAPAARPVRNTFPELRVSHVGVPVGASLVGEIRIVDCAPPELRLPSETAQVIVRATEVAVGFSEVERNATVRSAA